MTLWRAPFEAALRMFAAVSEALWGTGRPRPILVGRAAVEYWSGSAVSTGDFDVCSRVQPEFEAVLRDHGFVRPSGAGMATRGWMHPGLSLGFEVVGSTPLDGLVDRDRIHLIENLTPGANFAILGIEDLIADRMGQYASGTAANRIDQARLLFGLHSGLDLDYLERRIREESSGDYGVDDL
ncbi:hypothetical protein ASE73_02955 [Sphingomonas sp. Leaf24]|nr:MULTISPECIES: hypothetical protein [unclassified Sphingomonas]KQM23196.1 hypothetical protein ASE50_02955 [Sphingomonas sp. Leaf5]KQM77605.1 hypothetical protein ASE70_06880 [Sphingomonas sp. Leaf22]KQM96054.1 hypothetical protein ASE73_02955 [Sphingomonas sp. Leaf24]